MIPKPKTNARAEYRRQQTARMEASPSLAEQYGGLSSLTVNLEFFEAGGTRKITEIKYTVNLTHARTVFGFHCPRDNCVGGDFDLSQTLADAIASREATATGELHCCGRQGFVAAESTCCHSVLRYELNLEY